MSDLDHSISIGSVGMWVTPAEAEHARTLARVLDERTTENKLLQARLYLSEDREAEANSMSDMLAERVADLSELAAERGQAFARAWKLIQYLIAALVLSFAFALILAFK